MSKPVSAGARPFRELTNHSLDCLPDLTRKSIRDIENSGNAGCRRCQFNYEALLHCVPWLVDGKRDKPILSSFVGHTSSSLYLATEKVFMEEIQFFTADG